MVPRFLWAMITIRSLLLLLAAGTLLAALSSCSATRFHDTSSDPLPPKYHADD